VGGRQKRWKRIGVWIKMERRGHSRGDLYAEQTFLRKSEK
jgi:hypothetical protein